MNNIKNAFSIKDLENLTGIKAHTIRIWEKRYNLLEPMRTETNIRIYDTENLQKLLNINLLHKYGYKISNISKLSEEKIPELVNNILSDKSAKNHALSSFKIAMMNFDQALFLRTYDKLLSQKSFREIFGEIFVPFLIEIGFLWQTNTISIAHEHFMTYLIKQKLLINTEKIQYQESTKNDKMFVLYLPTSEIHELGLLYLNYEIQLSGYKTIYLGENVPITSLRDVKKYFNRITYICYMTVAPDKEAINNYVSDINSELLTDDTEFWVIGRMSEHIDTKLISEKTKIFGSINEIVSLL